MNAKISPIGDMLTVALLITLAILAVAYCPLPWSAGLLVVAIFIIVVAKRGKGRITVVLLVNSAAIAVAIAAFEGYLGIQQRQGDGTRLEGTVDDGTQPNDLLGYAPLKDSRLIARKLYENTAIYDVLYTINSDGLRIAPPVKESPTAGCIVFFGDSVTFGEGVDDDKPFAYQVGLKTGGQYAIYNFAYSGYGPHQMLAALQAGLVRRIVHCKPTHFVYLTIPEHIARVAGLTSWDKHGPYFRLDANGELIYAGNFDAPLQGYGGLANQVQGALRNFLTWQRFFGRNRQTRSADLTLLLAIVRAAARLAQAEFGSGEFHVLLWDGRTDDRFDLMEAALTQAGIPVHRVTEAIPDLRSNWNRYVLSVHDLHPNALQHELIADYLIAKLLRRTR
jgi:hypothetical protein